MFVAIIWLFQGDAFINAGDLTEKTLSVIAFIDGGVFVIGCLGIIVFVKTLLNISEILVGSESLPILMYRSVFDDELEGVFFKDKKGRYRLINDAARKVLGLSAREVIGSSDSCFYGIEKVEKIRLEDERVLNNKETVMWQTEVLTGSGRETYICKKIPCRDKNGNIVGISGICKNITVVKTFQNLNLELEERYRQFFDRLPYPVLVLDTTTLLPFTYNNKLLDLLGYTREEFSKIRLISHIDEIDLAVLHDLIAGLIKAGSGEFEFKLKCKDKNYVDVAGFSQEIIINEKQCLHMLMHDVTEIKRSTRSLISSELKYRSLFEYANDAILIVSCETIQIIDVNEIAISFLGYSRDELTYMSLFDLAATNESQVGREQIDNLEIYNHVLYEQKIKNRKGEIVDVEVNAHKVNYGEKEVYQYVLRNITKRKVTEKALKNSELRYRQMFETNRAIKLVINPVLRTIEDANPAALEFYGYSLDELKGMSLSRINILSKDKLEVLTKQSKEQKTGYYTCPHKMSNGEIRFVEVRDGSMQVEGKELLYSIIYDITETRNANERLMLASKMFDCSNDAVMITDSSEMVVSVNEAFVDVTGFQQSEIIGKKPEVFLARKNETLLNKDVIEQVRETGEWKGEVWHRLKGGEANPLKVTVNQVNDSDGNIANYVVLMTKSAAKNNSEQGDVIVNYTGLTGLPDRALFKDRLKKAIDRSRRSNSMLAVMLLDFRGFSTVNKSYDYDTGDQILKAIGRRIKYNVRESDTVAHFSSDDYAVLLEDIADIQQVGIVAQKILTTLSEGYQIDDKSIFLDVDIGVAVYPDDSGDVDGLMHYAEQALTSLQKKSPNNFELNSAVLNRMARKWVQVDRDLHRALKNNEFEVYFLPQINLANKLRIEAMEVLLRWNAPGKGLLLPGNFLPNAEQSGFISAIGFKIIDVGFNEYDKWLKRGFDVGRLSFNISLTQLDDELVGYFQDKCKQYKIACEAISLDFNESKMLESSSQQVAVLTKIHEAGFQLCIDDFGKNMASVASFMHYPVNAIKLDRSLVDKIETSESAVSLIKGLVLLCNNLDIQVIAEGVETAAQLQILKDIGCEHMQGFVFGAPIEASAAVEYIDSYNR
ncbi:MAG: PAS domain S-box protein [Gammaproteobacteria bacterium]|nr:PAS domain S-box protein [Gammaproteobacteria bacterium]